MSNVPFQPPTNPSTNPYAPSYPGYASAMRPNDSMPTFCLTMFIISLCLCLLRIPVVIFGVFGWMGLEATGQANQPIALTVPFEVLSGAAIVVLGISANVGLLLKQRWGVSLGYLTVVACFISMALALWQLSILFQATTDDAQRVGFVVGAVLTLIIRLTIVGLWLSAVLKFSRWLDTRSVAV
jgi:hypothetical protein